jgi:hypothetical protein
MKFEIFSKRLKGDFLGDEGGHMTLLNPLPSALALACHEEKGTLK